MKPKLLCILHRSPPFHGAAKVGDFISESKALEEAFDCKFITIKSSDTIENIGKVNFKKIYLIIELYIKVLFALLSFRPDKIYFTSSVRGIALYRDVLLSSTWKLYSLFKNISIYYHYHTKGVKDFVSSSTFKLKLTNFFVKNVHLVLLSPLLASDFEKVTTYKDILYLPNGVENTFTENAFETYITQKDFKTVHILYLSNMIKSKGYFEVLKLAEQNKETSYHFHFAGGWQNDVDEKEFSNFITMHKLEKNVTFHGFINGVQKKALFEKANIFIFPTRYKNEAFPLSVLEAFSYGLPVLSTNEASIPYIINQKSGITIDALTHLPSALDTMVHDYINIDTARYCRQRYLENFTLDAFEKNLVSLFEGLGDK